MEIYKMKYDKKAKCLYVEGDQTLVDELNRMKKAGETGHVAFEEIAGLE